MNYSSEVIENMRSKLNQLAADFPGLKEHKLWAEILQDLDALSGDPAPTLSETNEAHPEGDQEPADEDAEEQIKILVVDDNPQYIQLSQLILQREGYTTLGVRSAEEALELLQQKNEFSLILSDIKMPGMDGYEFCRRVKADPKTQNIPFIFFTSFSRNSREAMLSSQIGAEDYITRPFTAEELIARVDSILSLHQAE